MRAAFPPSPPVTLNQAIRRYPATVAVFDHIGIDACRGGAAAIDPDAARPSTAVPHAGPDGRVLALYPFAGRPA